MAKFSPCHGKIQFSGGDSTFTPRAETIPVSRITEHPAHFRVYKDIIIREVSCLPIPHRMIPMTLL